MNNFDQTRIEAAVAEVIRMQGVSDKVFYNRPRSSTLDLKDFVVCHVTGAVKDLAAFGICTVSVHLYARDVSGMKNGERLSVMQSSLREGITPAIGDLLLDIRGIEPVGDVSDKNGYHVRMIMLNSVIIKIV